MNKAYKFRLYPNKEQEILFTKTFGCTRFIYNKMLGDKISYYKEHNEKLNNTPAQYKDEFAWLKDVDSLALANAQQNLQTAYTNFFRSPKTGFPKFKSKHKSKLSYTTNNQRGSIRIQDKCIKLPKIGFVKFKQHRALPDECIIKSCTISKTATNKYFISILVDYDFMPPEITLAPDNFIGLDMDMKHLFTDSNGIRADYPRYYRNTLDKLAKAQRLLSHCQKGSNNRHKQKVKVAKIHKTIANQRKDFLHKLSRQITNDYDGVCIEDLNMQSMSQCLKLGKSVHDNGWGMFTNFTLYKLSDQGKPLIKISKWFPSSKTCSNCGAINEALTLADRNWICTCGAHHDRDWNAAINIRHEGINILLSA